MVLQCWTLASEDRGPLGDSSGGYPFFRGSQRIFRGLAIRSRRFSDVSTNLKLDDRFLPST